MTGAAAGEESSFEEHSMQVCTGLNCFKTNEGTSRNQRHQRMQHVAPFQIDCSLASPPNGIGSTRKAPPRSPRRAPASIVAAKCFAFWTLCEGRETLQPSCTNLFPQYSHNSVGDGFREAYSANIQFRSGSDLRLSLAPLKQGP